MASITGKIEYHEAPPCHQERFNAYWWKTGEGFSYSENEPKLVVEAEPPDALGHDFSENEQQRVIDALADERWDFRTVRGISKSTGLLESRVTQILRDLSGVVKSSIPNEKGEDLFTLNRKFSRAKDVFNVLRTFVSKSLD